MNYYTAQQTIELLNKELPHNPLPYDLAQLADLCSREVLTPVFYYSKCLDRIDPQNIAHAQPQTIEPCTFSGYLTTDSLISLIHAPATTTHSIRIDYATVYEVIKAGYKWLIDNAFSRLFIKGELVVLCGHEQAHDDRYPMTTHDLKEHDAASVRLNDLLFPSEQVQRYITTHDFADVSTPEQQRIAELESQLADLRKQSNQKPDNTVSSLLTAIHDKNHDYHAPDLSHSIKLWSDLYINGKIGSDSHSNKADIWINNNTGYADNAKSSVGRIREIATPLKDFGAKRSKETKK